jgi:hypothetical protein
MWWTERHADYGEECRSVLHRMVEWSRDRRVVEVLVMVAREPHSDLLNWTV